MKRIYPLSKPPAEATAGLEPEVFLTLVRDIIDVFIIFLTDKDPQNPITIGDGGDDGTNGDGGTTTGV